MRALTVASSISANSAERPAFIQAASSTLLAKLARIRADGPLPRSSFEAWSLPPFERVHCRRRHLWEIGQCAATLAGPAIQKRFLDLGLDVASKDQQTPEGLAAFNKGEIEKWWPVMKAAGIKPE